MTEFEKAMKDLGKKAEPKQADLQSKGDQPKQQQQPEIRRGLCTIGDLFSEIGR